MSLSSLPKLLASLSLFACTSLFAAPLVINVAGIESRGQMGEAGNTVLLYDVGANATITSIAYDVNLTAIDPSYLSEISLLFTDSSRTDGVIFSPGFGDDESGTASYAGAADLLAFALAFDVGADGILRLEFHEDFDDFRVSPDGRWNFGSITFGIDAAASAVPEPATALLFGAGAMLIGLRRRI